MGEENKAPKTMRSIIFEIWGIDTSIEAQYKRRDKLVKKLLKKYEPGHYRIVMEDEETDLKVYLTDNKEKFLAGEAIFKTTAVKRFSAKYKEVKKLKRGDKEWNFQWRKSKN